MCRFGGVKFRAGVLIFSPIISDKEFIFIVQLVIVSSCDSRTSQINSVTIQYNGKHTWYLGSLEGFNVQECVMESLTVEAFATDGNCHMLFLQF